MCCSIAFVCAQACLPRKEMPTLHVQGRPRPRRESREKVKHSSTLSLSSPTQLAELSEPSAQSSQLLGHGSLTQLTQLSVSRSSPSPLTHSLSPQPPASRAHVAHSAQFTHSGALSLSLVNSLGSAGQSLNHPATQSTTTHPLSSLGLRQCSREFGFGEGMV